MISECKKYQHLFKRLEIPAKTILSPMERNNIHGDQAYREVTSISFI